MQKMETRFSKTLLTMSKKFLSLEEDIKASSCEGILLLDEHMGITINTSCPETSQLATSLDNKLNCAVQIPDCICVV